MSASEAAPALTVEQRLAALQTQGFELYRRGIRGEALRVYLSAIATVNEGDDCPLEEGAVVQVVANVEAHCAAAQIDGEALHTFAVVDLSDTERARETTQSWAWDQYMPCGEVTSLNAHGGTGKSTMALHLGVCQSMGRAYLGIPTGEARRVCFYSAEDQPNVVLRRLGKICRVEGIEPATLAGRLFVLDATVADPVLFAVRRVDGVNRTLTTAAYSELADYMAFHDIDVLIVDNASDTFDADEINRTHVRAFIRALKRLGTVLLLAHVDKGTSRAGKAPLNGETYSGSTAWHNSVRSRLALLQPEPGQLELRHEKSNFGRKRDALLLDWPDDGLPAPAGNGAVARLADNTRAAADTRAVLALLDEFASRGEWVSPSTSSPTNAVRLLSGQPGYPAKLQPRQVFDLLRVAERDGLIERTTFRTPQRKEKDGWQLTYAGRTFVGAPTAPSAQSCTVGADDASVRQVRQPPPIGGGWRTQVCAPGVGGV